MIEVCAATADSIWYAALPMTSVAEATALFNSQAGPLGVQGGGCNRDGDGAECGMRNAECGMRNAECGMGSG